MEVRALLAEMLPRIDGIETAGPAQLLRANFIGGLKNFPIRYSVRSGASR